MDVTVERLSRRSFSRSASPHGRSSGYYNNNPHSRSDRRRTQVEQIYHSEEGGFLLPRSDTVLGYLSRKPRFSFVTSASQDREREKDREQDARDRHKEIEGGGGGGGGGASTTVLPPANAKTQHTNYSSFRPMNARNNFLGGQQINPLPSQKTQQSSNTSSSNSKSLT